MQVTHLGIANTGEYGLGNQMFQVAATIGIATKNKLQYGFPDWHNNKLFSKKLPRVDVGQGVIIKEKSFEYNPVELSGNCFTSLEGYFQSWKYFDDYFTVVLKAFQFNDHHFSFVKNIYDSANFGKTCSISVRRGDYLTLQNIHPLQPDNYWIQAQELVESKMRSINSQIDTYLVFSDDIPWCKKNKHLFNRTGKKVIFVEGRNQGDDFMMITLCNCNIITNSTFSWWGAYLNKNPDNVVVMPKTWFGPAGPWSGPSNADDLQYPTWHRI